MKKLLVVLLLVSIAFVRAEEKKLGKEISLKEKTSISKILSAPDKFDGKTVLVEGKVLGVCQEKGCWIDIAGEKKNEKIRVKVKDGEIVFPKDAKGKTVMVEGVLASVKGDACDEKETKDTKEAGCCAKEKEAKTVKDKKAASCCSDEKMAKAYQIQGSGAVIR